MGESGFQIFFDLAIILLVTKVFGLIMRRLGLPQVVGALIGGLLIGPLIWGANAPVKDSVPLTVMAEIGVVLIMFTAGLETNLKEMKKYGKASLIITSLGVIVPLGLGYLVSGAFHGMGNYMTNLFVGTIITATSVGITVEALKEMGKLKGKVGCSILSAAILDDIIGIVILTIVISLNNSVGGDSDVNVGKAVGETILRIVLFFVAAGILGFLIHKLMRFLEKKFDRTRRLPIFGLITCFLFAWAAEKFFGIADITGAYAAGIVFSNMKNTEYVEKKIDTNSYMLFSPIFFAHIGITASINSFSWEVALFGICLILAAFASKIIGCGVGAKVAGFTTKESWQVGVGMAVRGEVALIVATKGLDVGLLGGEYIAIVIIMVIVTSLITPILLKYTFKTSKKELRLMHATGIMPESYSSDNCEPCAVVEDLTHDVFGFDSTDALDNNQGSGTDTDAADG